MKYTNKDLENIIALCEQDGKAANKQKTYLTDAKMRWHTSTRMLP